LLLWAPLLLLFLCPRNPKSASAPGRDGLHTVPSVPRKSKPQRSVTISESTDRGSVFSLPTLDTFGAKRGDIGDNFTIGIATQITRISPRTSSSVPGVLHRTPCGLRFHPTERFDPDLHSGCDSADRDRLRSPSPRTTIDGVNWLQYADQLNQFTHHNLSR
jgi:hypothetical protein